jgi:diguanylate cyclase (GGDEF)-like protein
MNSLRCRSAHADSMLRGFVVWSLATLLCLPAGAAEEESAPVLIERSTVAMRANPDESKEEAERALAIVSRHPDVDLEIRARLLLCDYYSERDVIAAQQQIDAVDALLPQARRKSLSAGALTCRGEIRQTSGDIAQAKTEFDDAVAVATTAKDEQMLAEALFKRGYVRALQGEYAAGMSDVRRSQELFERIHMPQHALMVFNTIATIYNRMGDYTQAAQIYEHARSRQHDAGLRRDEAVTLYNLGRTRQKLGEWDAARLGFSGCVALSHEINFIRGEAYGLLGLASVDNANGDPNGALRLLAQSGELTPRVPEARLNAQIQLARGTALGQLRRNAEALAALGVSATAFKQANSLEDLGTTYGELATVEAQMGDWRSAYEYRSEAQVASEQLLHTQLDQRFATLKAEFDTATKEKENALLQRQNAATESELAQERRANTLQTAVILLSLLLLGLLTVLVLRQRRGARRMHALAMTDELTGAPNRRAVLNYLDAQLQRAEAAPCSILVIDVDRFKTINDEHGHAIGDMTLQLVTARLRSAAVEPALLGRLGGEEFVVVLPSTELHDAHLIAERIRAQVPSVDLSTWLGDRRITVSIGVATSSAGDTVSSLLRRADAALYIAKSDGRNCVRSDAAPDINAATA